jgi:hypothetical protein
MIMYYDTWHRATSSSLESDLFVPVEARNAEDTRHMCKFRFWRMYVLYSPHPLVTSTRQWCIAPLTGQRVFVRIREEPSAPTWDHDPQRAFDPPVDAPFPDHFRITPATRSVFNWMTGHADCATKHDTEVDALSGLSTDTLIQRLTWYSDEWSVELQEQFRRGGGPANPPVTPETGQPAVLASLNAAYELATREDALEQLITACMCGGVTITPDRALGAWAVYNASYGLASVVPTPEALAVLLPPCIETLKGNPYALAPPELRVARDYVSPALLCSIYSQQAFDLLLISCNRLCNLACRLRLLLENSQVLRSRPIQRARFSPQPRRWSPSSLSSQQCWSLPARPLLSTLRRKQSLSILLPWRPHHHSGRHYVRAPTFATLMCMFR